MTEQTPADAESTADITQTPEFAEAVAKAAAAAAEKAVADAMAKMPAPAPATDAGALGAILSNLAMQFAELSHQGVGQKPVSPELIRRREEGATRMWSLIRRAREEGRIATYRLRTKQFLGEEVIEPNWVRASDHTYQPTDVDWDAVPNQGMEPLNETAKEIYAAFEDSIAGTIRPVRNQEGMLITGRVVVKNDPNRVHVGATTEEMQAANAIEGAALSNLRIHRQESGGYEQRQILGSTPAGRAMVTK